MCGMISYLRQLGTTLNFCVKKQYLITENVLGMNKKIIISHENTWDISIEILLSLMW